MADCRAWAGCQEKTHEFTTSCHCDHARKTKVGDDERIVLVTDRPIGFWEAKNQPRVADYPFTVIELRIKPNGEGKLSVATKITADPEGRGIVLENYGISARLC